MPPSAPPELPRDTSPVPSVDPILRCTLAGMRTISAMMAILLALIGCSEPLASVDGGAPDAQITDGQITDAETIDSGEIVRLDGATPDGGPAACGLPAAFDVGLAPSRTLHVATTGAAGGDGSEGAPLDTIAHAAALATPGTRILVHAGVYLGAQWIADLHGEASAPITIVGEDGAILDGDGEGEVLHLSEVSYVVLEHLELRNATGNGLNIDDGGTLDTPAHHVVLRDLFVHDIGSGGNQDCIKLSGLDDYFVLGSRITQCDAGDMIDHVGCHRGVIADNHFYDSPGSGGIQMKGGSSDILVHGNRFTDVSGRSINAGGSTGLEFFRPLDAPFEAARLHVIANVFLRSGANSGAPIAFVGCDACLFANNTVLEPQEWIARILQESTDARFVPSRNGRFVNNLIVFRVADLRTFVNVGGGTAPETFTFSHNLWYALDDASFAGPTLTDGIPAETSAVIQMNPGVSEGSPDLCTGSPGWNAGLAYDALCVDIHGQEYWEPPSIGADQAGSCTD